MTTALELLQTLTLPSLATRNAIKHKGHYRTLEKTHGPPPVSLGQTRTSDNARYV
jgi:hypothetical protein